MSACFPGVGWLMVVVGLVFGFVTFMLAAQLFDTSGVWAFMVGFLIALAVMNFLFPGCVG